MSMVSKSDLFWDAITRNYTPDMYERRYSGPVKVFLTGEFSDATNLNEFIKENKLDRSEDFATVSFRAHTQGKFCLYQNMNRRTFQEKDFLFVRHHNIVHPQNLTNRILRGRIISCSLKGLSALDRVFRNSIATSRIPIRMNPLHSNGIDTAFVYFHRLPFHI